MQVSLLPTSRYFLHRFKIKKKKNTKMTWNWSRWVRSESCVMVWTHFGGQFTPSRPTCGLPIWYSRSRKPRTSCTDSEKKKKAKKKWGGNLLFEPFHYCYIVFWFPFFFSLFIYIFIYFIYIISCLALLIFPFLWPNSIFGQGKSYFDDVITFTCNMPELMGGKLLVRSVLGPFNISKVLSFKHL